MAESYHAVRFVLFLFSVGFECDGFVVDVVGALHLFGGQSYLAHID